jgi:hypothetical protein
VRYTDGGLEVDWYFSAASGWNETLGTVVTHQVPKVIASKPAPLEQCIIDTCPCRFAPNAKIQIKVHGQYAWYRQDDTTLAVQPELRAALERQSQEQPQIAAIDVAPAELTPEQQKVRDNILESKRNWAKKHRSEMKDYKKRKRRETSKKRRADNVLKGRVACKGHTVRGMHDTFGCPCSYTPDRNTQSLVHHAFYNRQLGRFDHRGAHELNLASVAAKAARDTQTKTQAALPGKANLENAVSRPATPTLT